MRNFENGTTDKPITNMQEDEFELKPYISGLGDFILACQTPMTIAIQGDWGSGKTSMMNMVNEYLKDASNGNVESVWFNTWQFSQFEMDSMLATNFLMHLTNKLQIHANSKTSIIETGKKIAGIIGTFSLGIFSKYAGEEIANELGKKITTPLDYVEQIENLKQNFNQLVKEVTTDGKRVVVFIDDLDRLQPVHAVGLLEILKLFVDCENCIFVIAIDTSVVFQGIREKYGADINDDKAQSFFDKMIQLPFKMPIVNYKLDESIIKTLGLRNLGLNQDDIDECIQVVKMTAAGNPRSIKRIANFYLLTDKVAQSKRIYDNLKSSTLNLCRKIMLYSACVQLNYEKLYNFLLKENDYTIAQRIRDLNLPPQKDNAKKYEILKKELADLGAPEYRGDDYLNYAGVVYTFLQTCKKLLESGYESSDKIENNRILLSLLSLTTITDIENKELAHSPSSFSTCMSNNPSPTQINDISNTLFSELLNEGKTLDIIHYLNDQNIYPQLPIGEPWTQTEQYNIYINRFRNGEEKPQLAVYLHNKLKDIFGTIKSTPASDTYCLNPSSSSFSIRMLFHYTLVNIQAEIVSELNNNKIWNIFSNMVDELEKEYHNLQAQFGEIIFKEQFFRDGLTPVFDEKNTIISYRNKESSNPQIYLANQKMADIFENGIRAIVSQINKKEPPKISREQQDKNTISDLESIKH